MLLLILVSGFALSVGSDAIGPCEGFLFQEGQR